MDQVLVAIALALVAVIAGFFAWSFTDLAGQINRVINFSPAATQGANFDIKGAAALDWKGLVATSSAQSASASSTP